MIEESAPENKPIWLGLLIVFCLSVLISCAPEAEKSQIIERSGVVYLIGAKEPFSGYITGHSREDYRSKVCAYKKAYNNGVLNGDTKFWYPNGNLESIEPYSNGRLNGNVIRYYETGKKKSRISMVNGMRGGASGEYFWSRDGKPLKDS